MGIWEDVGRPLLTPTADQYYRAAGSIDSARKEYDTAFNALQQYEDRQEAIDRDAVWDELSRTGKLTSTTAAKALGALRAAKTNRMAAAQMQAQMYRAAARQRQAELGSMAKSATAGDLMNLGMKVGGTALGMAGAGMFSKPVTAGAGATAAEQAAAATKNAARFNPVMAGIGEAMGGIGGGGMTAEATRGKYPELLRNPMQEYYDRLANGAVNAPAVAAQAGNYGQDFDSQFPDLAEELYRRQRAVRYPSWRR